MLPQSLVRALMAGTASVEEAFSRTSKMLGRPWRWLRPVARRFVRRFEGRTRPRQREVIEFLRRDQSFALAWWRYPRELQVRAWLTEPQQMLPVAAAIDWDVPVLESSGAMAEWLGLTPGELDWFADLKALSCRRSASPQLGHYRYQMISKPDGTARVVESPKPRLKQIQRKILHDILEKIPPHAAAHGFVKGRSIRTFAAPHAGKRVVLRMDLRDFFPSLSGVRIQTIFRTIGYPESVADLLGGICTTAVPRAVTTIDLYRRPHLPQGAPTSPAIANICAYRLDCRLRAFAKAAGATYTRYADDLAFSGNEAFERGVDRFLLHVAAIATEEGFSVNHRKTRVMRQGVRQHLAGLVTNARVNVMRQDFDGLKAILTNCIRYGPDSQNRDRHPRFRQHLEGRVSFVESINPEKAKRLRRLLDRIVW